MVGLLNFEALAVTSSEARRGYNDEVTITRRVFLSLSFTNRCSDLARCSRLQDAARSLLAKRSEYVLQEWSYFLPTMAEPHTRLREND